MRGLELPLDYQIEEGTLVVTARLNAAVGEPKDVVEITEFRKA